MTYKFSLSDGTEVRVTPVAHGNGRTAVRSESDKPLSEDQAKELNGLIVSTLFETGAELEVSFSENNEARGDAMAKAYVQSASDKPVC